jgi:hypothetical protein
MNNARLNDLVWVNCLDRAKATIRYTFRAIHLCGPLRDAHGAAPIVLETASGFLRAPKHLEAPLELCLRHLHGRTIPLPDNVESLTPQALMVNRALEALQLPARYVPTAEGDGVIDLAKCREQAATLDTVPVPLETEPVPLGKKPVPLETEPVPLETEPVPLEIVPVPLEIVPVPVEIVPVSLEAEPVAMEIDPVPLETEPVPLETEPVPLGPPCASSLSKKARKRAARKVRKRQKVRRTP